MLFEEYRKYDALGLAELVRKREVTPQKLLDIAIRRAEEVNPQINAIVSKMYDEGMKMLTNFPADAPFSGVPFLIKDLGIPIAGTTMQSGSAGYRNYVTPTDGILAQRLRAAGFIFMGKTNTPEFGLTPFTEPRAYGPTRNPWNTNYTSGGSSGGSAAAVAAGISPIATASDGGGSIRIPAACCGIFGLKPTRGRIPLGDGSVEKWYGAVVENCVSRSVRDTAAFLDAMQGSFAGNTCEIKPPVRPYLDELKLPVGKLRIGFCNANPFLSEPDPDSLAAVGHTVSLLRQLGHRVEEVALPYDRNMLIRYFTPLIFAETAAVLEEMRQKLGRPISTQDVELNTWLSAKLGEYISGKEVSLARYKWNELALKMGRFHEQFDLLLTPTLGRRPIKIGELQNSAVENTMLKVARSMRLVSLAARSNLVEKTAAKLLGYIPFTPLANMTGQPSVSIPLYWTDKENLPIGTMFTARIGAEDVLLRLAAQLEQAQPWFAKVPM